MSNWLANPKARRFWAALDPQYTAVEVTAMRKVEHIEQQIRELTGGEFSELRDWVLGQDWKAWDAQIEADARSGKLDELIAEAQSDYAVGRTRPL